MSHFDIKIAVLSELYRALSTDNIYATIPKKERTYVRERARIALVEYDHGSASALCGWMPRPQKRETVNHYAERCVGYYAQRRAVAARFEGGK